MYEAFYGLEADPFRLSSDPHFCFNHHSYARAKAYVQYALHRAEGFVMITGKPGTGKTTLVHDLLESLATQPVVTGTLVSTQLEAEDLLLMTGHAFGLDFPSTQKALVLQRLTEFMAQQDRQGKRTLLIIDEAQDLAASALEELRLLTNLQRNGVPLLQIALLGQEPLRDLVRRPDMQQVHQRLIASWRLEPLEPEETVGYVRHRLERAGWTGDPVLERGVLPMVHAFSAGVPRRINLICSRLLLKGFIEERHTLTPEDADTVVQDLYNEDLAMLEFEPDSPAARALESGDGAASILGTGTDVETWARIDQGLFGPQDPRASDSPPAAAPEPWERQEAGTHESTAAQRPEAVGHEPSEMPGPALDEPRPTTNQPVPEPDDETPRFAADPEPPAPIGSDALRTEDRPEALERVVPIAPRPAPAQRERSRFTPWIIGLFAVWLVLVAALLLPNEMEESAVAALEQWWSGQPMAQEAEPVESTGSGIASRSAEDQPDQLSRLHESTPPAADPRPEPGPGVLAAAPETTLVIEQILFAINSTTVDPPFESRLAEVAELLEQTPDAYADITGYTDRFGDPEYNLALSRQRAQSVANRLIARGVASDRLRIQGRGQRNPTPEEGISREEQRKVEVRVLSGMGTRSTGPDS
ncbi:MAG: DUF2075 domain-containing protein [Thioalkalivibrio sp.]|nr:MAG: DUF2075 domain-containing protein [Thioalkalivibrio sp.]